MKKFLVYSSVVLAASLWFSAPLAASESAIVRYDSSEVKLKSAADCNNEFKSSFIKKINKLSNGSGVNARRFERLKTEIKKLRERAVARIEKINAQVGKLNEEKINLSCLLKELDSSEIAFNKIKILPDEKTSENGLVK